MYTPLQFKEDRLPILHDLMQQARLASLITLGGEGLEASHVPVLIDPTEGFFGTIHGHLARGNQQWRGTDPSVPALVIFTGPDAYITPSWYETKAQTGKVVPTWNYVAVHAYGEIEFYDDPEKLLAVVTTLTNKHEKNRSDPWAVTDAPEDFIQAQLKGIVGFKIPITRLEGKSKMSQNRPQEDQQGVIAGLQNDEGTPEAAVAEAMSRKP